MVNGKLVSRYNILFFVPEIIPHLWLCQKTENIRGVIVNYGVWLNQRRMKSEKYDRYSPHYSGGCWRRSQDSSLACYNKRNNTLLLWNGFAILYLLWKYSWDIEFVISLTKNLNDICYFIFIFWHMLL